MTHLPQQTCILCYNEHECANTCTDHIIIKKRNQHIILKMNLHPNQELSSGPIEQTKIFVPPSEHLEITGYNAYVRESTSTNCIIILFIALVQYMYKGQNILVTQVPLVHVARRDVSTETNHASVQKLGLSRFFLRKKNIYLAHAASTVVVKDFPTWKVLPHK